MSKHRGKRQHIRVGERRIIAEDRAWYVAATWGIATAYDEAEADRQADKALRDAGLDVWLPVYESTVVRRGRKIDCELHFFPGYLFVGLPCETEKVLHSQMAVLRRCRHVTAILGRDGPLRVPHGLMQAIADAFSGDVKSERLQAAALYKVGELMRVQAGPFASFYAMVTELLQSGHVRGEVSIFGRSTPVVFEPDQLAQA